MISITVLVGNFCYKILWICLHTTQKKLFYFHGTLQFGDTTPIINFQSQYFTGLLQLSFCFEEWLCLFWGVFITVSLAGAIYMVFTVLNKSLLWWTLNKKYVLDNKLHITIIFVCISRATSCTCVLIGIILYNQFEMPYKLYRITNPWFSLSIWWGCWWYSTTTSWWWQLKGNILECSHSFLWKDRISCHCKTTNLNRAMSVL